MNSNNVAGCLTKTQWPLSSVSLPFRRYLNQQSIIVSLEPLLLLEARKPYALLFYHKQIVGRKSTDINCVVDKTRNLFRLSDVHVLKLKDKDLGHN